jgi:hypothetical protein
MVPHRAASGVQIIAKNVLLMFVTTHQSTHRDTAGHTTPIANMIGQGSVVLFRNGVRIVLTIAKQGQVSFILAKFPLHAWPQDRFSPLPRRIREPPAPNPTACRSGTPWPH